MVIVERIMTNRVRAAAALAALALTLTGCGSAGADASGQDVSDTGFVAGDGSIVVVPEDQRVPAPALTGTTLDGGTFTLADHLGEVVVLNVWASWCAPCRAEAPTLAALSDEFAGRGVQFVGLDTRDSDVPARAFVERFGITYPNVIDQDGRLQLLFGESLPPQAIPSTLVIDPQGRVAARALGKVSESSLRGMIEPLLPTAP
jgi:thiol-disulfide isomerase/thioredoxin